MVRRPTWQADLAGLVESRLRVPFRWGTNDCATFAADAVQAIRGADVLADLRGTWSDSRGAARVMRSLGGLVVAVDARLERTWTTSLWTGDVVLYRGARGLTLGVYLSERIATPGAEGLVYCSVEQAEIAWRV